MSRRPSRDHGPRRARLGADPLTAAGCDTPRLDAEVLLAAALGVDRAALIADSRRELSRPAGAGVHGLRAPPARARARRLHHRPQGLPASSSWQVDRRVLIPRPETEHRGRGGAGAAGGRAGGRRGHGLGRDRAGARSTSGRTSTCSATDVSADALDVARANALRLGLDVDVRRTATCWRASRPTPSSPTRPTSRRGARLMPEVARYEPPRRAVRRRRRAGRDPPARAAPVAPFLALEHGEGQADAVEALAAGGGLRRGGARARPRGDRARGRRAALTTQARARRVRRGGRRRRLPRRHGLRARVRSRERGRGRAALRAQGPPAGQARGGDVLRPDAADAGPRTARCGAAAGRRDAAAPQPERRFPLACTTDPETLGLRVPFLAPVGRPVLQSSREPRRRPGRAAARRCPGVDPRGRRPRDRRRRAARHAVDGDRPAQRRGGAPRVAVARVERAQRPRPDRRRSPCGGVEGAIDR